MVGHSLLLSLRKIPQKAGIFLGSHTDSPSLRIKPHAEFSSENMNLFRVDSYGGPSLYSWLDKELAVTGVAYTSNGKAPSPSLIYDKDHPVFIPSLAIHLQDRANGKPLKHYIDRQEHMCPIVSLNGKEKGSIEKIIKRFASYKSLLSFDLYLVPTQAPGFIGDKKELFCGYRIDNLSSAHAMVIALEKATPKKDSLQMGIFYNHEEIGSNTNEGAAGKLVHDTLQRICDSYEISFEDYALLKNNSLMISIDVSHAFHPNFSKKHDPQDHPLFESGIILKQNANLRYMSSAETTAKIVHLCTKEKINHQISSGHSEIRCGSTIGPVIASNLGIDTIDLGLPLLGMHSTRELIASKDHLSLCNFADKALKSL